MMIRAAIDADIAAIQTIAVDTDMFGPAEVGFVDDTVTGVVDGTLEGHRWLVARQKRRSVVVVWHTPGDDLRRCYGRSFARGFMDGSKRCRLRDH